MEGRYRNASTTSVASATGRSHSNASMFPPMLQRSMTADSFAQGNGAALGGQAPAQATSGAMLNRSNAVSLYQTCRFLSERLKRVPEFEERYLQPSRPLMSAIANDVAQSPIIDPVSELWTCFRLGASLCHLYNATLPDQSLAVREDPTEDNLKACKAEVFHFIIACRDHLHFGADDIFTISELFSENTNGFVKVTHTVSLVLDMLEERKLLIERDSAIVDTRETPKENRAKVTEELLQTERKYVQSLEILQNYVRELVISEVISKDRIHKIFGNLNFLVDFQRRFLIGIESTCALPADQQRIGSVFANLEEAFEVYTPFCANYSNAAELVLEETPNLQRLSHLIEPTYELPSLLIKPVQRICKYPLLLRELIKATNPDSPLFPELLQGEAAIKRVTDSVNEAQRRQENDAIRMDLDQRVDDWKGHSLNTFGQLLLQDLFTVLKGDVEREYRVYLFERILLCCKDNNQSKKSSKSMSIGKKPPKRGSLQLKGRIFINNVTDVVPSSKGGSHTLQVFWNGDMEQEYFTLRMKHDEQLKQWHLQIAKLLAEARRLAAERMAQQQANQRGVSNTQFASLEQVKLEDIRRGYESDDSEQTEETYEDRDSLGGVPMSREVSGNSFLSRSAVGGPLTGYRTTGNGVSHFSPTESAESMYRNRANGVNRSHSSLHDSDRSVPMNRTTSSESYRPLFNSASRQNSGNSFVSGQPLQQPGSAQARMRSMSSPHQTYRPNPAPQMPPPMPSAPSHSAVYLGSRQPSYSSDVSVSRADNSRASRQSYKVKVHYLDDAFLIALPHDKATFESLTERVIRKVRLCSSRGNELTALRVRYRDEDGDLVRIEGDEDVAMALESFGNGGEEVLELFATAIAH